MEMVNHFRFQRKKNAIPLQRQRIKSGKKNPVEAGKACMPDWDRVLFPSESGEARNQQQEDYG
jgi:hypothetical protein